MHGCQLVLFTVSVTLSVGCNAFSSKQPSSTPSFLRGSDSQIRERLLNSIPVGTSDADAERIAKSLGLELTPDSSVDAGVAPAIHCRYIEKRRLSGQTMWLIQIDCPDGKVTDILCEQIGIDYTLFDSDSS
jgi:hypothetical protein